jgi:hypothetical protein
MGFHLLIFNMFYLGFSDCASAELFLIVCFSFMFYYFHAKKSYIYKFFGGRPLDSRAVRGEVYEFDKNIATETFFSEYGDILEYSSFYEQWFYESDAIEQVVNHAENTVIRDNARKELQKFIQAEVTER